MPVDAIGSTLGSQSGASSQSAALQQSDFIRLFLAQLSFQDPLEPVDNREFLAQMAQFAGLEQARATTENVSNLVFMNATAQSIGLLGRDIEVASATGNVPGSVTAIQFAADGPQLTVQLAGGSVLTGIKLSQVRLVRF